MVDRQKVKLFLICIICAGLGSYCAKLIFDQLAKQAIAKPPVDHISPQPPPPLTDVAPIPIAIHEETKKPEPQETKKAPRPALSINGIMFSPGSSYALINNKIVKEGDSIEGLIVTKISQDHIELKDGDTLLKISPNNKSF